MEYFAKANPVQIRWDNIDYVVEEQPGPFDRCKKNVELKKTHILHDLNGVVEPGQLLAIMGPSGSGKTSLLNVLSSKLSGKHDGHVYINGQVANKSMIRRIGGFVPQEDVLFGSQTVREALQFYADLKLPNTLSDAQKGEMIDYMLEELGLKKVEHSLIGYVGADAAASGLPRGLSGGERKRLSIGCQLISNPSLLFLDEPTTGLDSYASESVIQTLNKLALQGRTIILTIHQPTVECLQMLDMLLLLGRGRTVYFGSNAQSLDYFAGIGYKCPSWENPANYLMDTIHGDSKSYEQKLDESPAGADLGSKFDHAEEQALKLADEYDKSDLKNFDLKKPPKPINMAEPLHRAGFFRATSRVFLRQGKHVLREPRALRAGMGQTIFIALIMGLLYLRLGHTNTHLSDRMGAIFFSIVFVSFGGLLGPFFSFAGERKIFLQQYSEGLYSTSVFYVSKLFAEMPMLLLNSALWSVIFYWMVNLRPGADHFFIYVGFIVLSINVAFAYGMMIVNIFPNQQVALQIFPVLFMPLMIFSGYYINMYDVPKYFIWIPPISFMKYAFQGISLNEFVGVPFNCTATELQTVQNVTYCPFTSGTTWVNYYYLNDFTMYGCAILLLEMIALFNLVAFCLLRRTAKTSSG